MEGMDLKEVREHLKEYRAKVRSLELAEKSLVDAFGDTWTCPDCGNIFGITDGNRYCTKSRVCTCSAMPQDLRCLRDYELYKRARSGYGLEHPELAGALIRLLSLHE